MIDNAAKWKFEGKKWENIGPNENNLYNWQTFQIYEQNKYLGAYQLLYNDRFLLYDEFDNPIKKQSSNMLAIRSNQKFKVAEYNIEEIDQESMKYVDSLLQDNQITDTRFIYKKMITYDIDSDGKDEKLIMVSNMFETEYAPKNIFCFIFMIKNDKITIVSKTVDTFDHIFKHATTKIHSLVDIDGNGKYEIITTGGYYNNNNRCIEMYEYQKNKYKKIKSCEA